jgi:hypothetical protein
MTIRIPALSQSSFFQLLYVYMTKRGWPGGWVAGKNAHRKNARMKESPRSMSCSKNARDQVVKMPIGQAWLLY